MGSSLILELRKILEFLSLAEFAYSSSWHSSIRIYLFHAVYGQDCNMPIKFSNPINWVQISHEMLERMEEDMKFVRGCIQDGQKSYYDKENSERIWERWDGIPEGIWAFSLYMNKKVELAKSIYEEVALQHQNKINNTNNNTSKPLIPYVFQISTS